MTDARLTPKDLSPDQHAVYDAMLGWAERHGGVGVSPARGEPGGNLLTIGGLGGTGKSTLLGVFASECRLHVAYCAFTGRAASVLARKLKACGVKTVAEPYHPSVKAQSSRYFSADPDATYCGTIHRLVYQPIINSREEVIGWRKRPQLDRGYDLIVVDEASMVSDEMLIDLKVHGIPILAVGDHGQLPPVASSGSVVQHPDLRLEKIHRQAADNPVIALAHHIREGGLIGDFRLDSSDERIQVMLKTNIDGLLPHIAADSLDTGLLCWTNRVRVKLNGKARLALQKSGFPRKGEIVICLRNEPPVFNGMRGRLLEDSSIADQEGPRPWELTARVEFPQEDLLVGTFTMCSAQFNREKTFSRLEEFEQIGIDIESFSRAGSLFDFGYALTTYKAQGSSFDHVVWYLDRPENPNDEDWRRFAYTAVTRSSNRLTILR